MEAGLRSGDLSMPREINRMVTDQLRVRFVCPRGGQPCTTRLCSADRPEVGAQHRRGQLRKISAALVASAADDTAPRVEFTMDMLDATG